MYVYPTLSRTLHMTTELHRQWTHSPSVNLDQAECYGLTLLCRGHRSTTYMCLAYVMNCLPSLYTRSEQHYSRTLPTLLLQRRHTYDLKEYE